jgi:uncharacterized OB-fold protein
MGIVERNQRNMDNGYWYPEEDSFPVRNRYTAGLAGQTFLKEIKENARIYGTYCQGCDVTYVPARGFCERCFAQLDTWVDVGLTGTVHSYTLAYRNKDGSPKSSPVPLAAIRLGDGLLVHWLEDCSPEEISIGMSVTAQFKPKQERRGSILDIKSFKPGAA